MDDLVVRALDELVPGGVRRGETRRGDRALRWVEAGTGEPVVVLDAGLGEPGTLAWAGVVPAISAHTRVIAYDRAGIGSSDPLVPLTVDTAVGDLVAVATEAGGGRCLLVGHSWGGLLVQLAALSHPDMVAGMVLVDPVHEEVLDGAPRWFRAMQWSYAVVPLALAPVRLQGQAFRLVYRPFAQRLSGDPRVRELILDAYASCYQQRSQLGSICQENRLAFGSVTACREARVGVNLPNVPLVVLSASRGLPPRLRRPWTSLQAALAHAAKGEHIVVPTGHSIHQERPEVVVEAIMGVLGRLRAGQRSG